jgi:ubiquinone biosynthesis protein
LEEVRPYVFDLLKQRYSPERLGAELLRRVERLNWMTTTVPDQLREVLDDMRLGRLAIRATDPTRVEALERLGGRLFTAILVSALLGCSAYLLVNGPGWAALTAGLLALGGVLVHLLSEGYKRLFGR